jgi:hypothetical protein
MGGADKSVRKRVLMKRVLIRTNVLTIIGEQTLDDQLQTIQSKHASLMPDKAYLIKFKETDVPPHLVIAARIEFHGEHLVFLKSDGTLAALCVLKIVESWSEIQL